MTNADSSGMKLGVNGFGRIGKLTVWHHVARKYFDEIIVNLGRPVGISLEDIAHYVERDSTYGWLHGYLYGHKGTPVIDELNESDGSMVIDGIRVRFLRKHRDPADIGWMTKSHPAAAAVHASFTDPACQAASAPPACTRSTSSAFGSP